MINDILSGLTYSYEIDISELHANSKNINKTNNCSIFIYKTFLKYQLVKCKLMITIITY